MAPINKESTAGSPILGGPADEVRNTTSANTQDQTLVKALQDLIVRVLDPKKMNDTDQIHLGPEAGKLITALQDFISSIVVRSQSRAQNTIIAVNLDEERKKIPGGDRVDENEKDEASAKAMTLPINISSEPDAKAIGNDNPGDLITVEKPQPTFEEKLKKALREHVFNQMPIRLLYFEPTESSFQIALIERGTIYGRLISVLEEKRDEEEFRPQEYSNGIMESDEGIIERLILKYARYAILSHTWLRTAPGEVTYGDWTKGCFNPEDLGYRKLVDFCKFAWKDYQLTFGWMDTVCINKESSSELDESIRSMYNWYERAAICIAYLAETGPLSDMHLDPWFTRGWTLQELLAPRVVKFYNGHWKQLADQSENDKDAMGITQQIERATTIARYELSAIRSTPISRRMQLAATREVTREEDTAYSLMGMFNVSISTAYGEGAERAFSRLLQEIMASSGKVLDILNWAGEIPSLHTYTSHLLPSSPKHYINRFSDPSLIFETPIEPLTITHLGLRVPLILMPGISISTIPDSPSQHNPVGNYNGIATISPLGYLGDIPRAYNLLGRRKYTEDGWKYSQTSYQMTFAVFNFSGGFGVRNTISLPKICIALGLECNEPAGLVTIGGIFRNIQTEEPIVFKLSRRHADTQDANHWSWQIRVDELPTHGMQLITLYL